VAADFLAPEPRHEAHDEAAQRRYEDDVSAQMIIRGRAVCQGDRLKEKHIGEEANGTQKKDCASGTDHTDHQGERRQSDQAMMAGKVSAARRDLPMRFAN
jgi:hypothetical protein